MRHEHNYKHSYLDSLYACEIMQEIEDVARDENEEGIEPHKKRRINNNRLALRNSSRKEILSPTDDLIIERDDSTHEPYLRIVSNMATPEDIADRISSQKDYVTSTPEDELTPVWRRYKHKHNL